jgi:glycosyltransferase involved in cell wall biosynthesis
MAVGVVPVVVDYGGPAELVSPASGYLLPMAPREELILALRRQLESIVEDPGQLAEKSWRGVERVFALFAWPAKARQTFEIYRWVLGWRADKPDMGLPFKDPAPTQEFAAGLAA